MRYRFISLALLAFVVTGCYRVTVNTGAPETPQRIDRPWQMSFAAGLLPPPEIESQTECPQGVAQVVTQRSFVNSLATMVTMNIISPMHTTVVCAGGPVRR